ncbi:MAG: GMC family oxidoreductase [Vicinamibacterales bacterium]
MGRPALPHHGAVGGGRRRRVRPLHALLPRRQHEVLGQRADPPAPGGLRRPRARRRRVAGLADRLRDPGPVLRPCGGPLRRARAGRRRPHRAALRAVSTCRCRTRAAGAGHRRRAPAQGLRPFHLPLGVRAPGESDGCVLCNTCNSFPCRLGAKSDAEACAVAPVLGRPNLTLWTGAEARRLLTNPSGTRVEAIEIQRRGRLERVEAPLVVVSCGAVNSAALLLRSASDRHPRGLANSSDLVGRRYMAHLATMMQGFHPFRRNDTVFQKTVALNDYYFEGPDAPHPLGHIQSQGRTHGIMAKVVGDTIIPGIPLGAYDAWVARGVDWLAMSEDLPRRDNRVSLTPDGRIRLDYVPNNVAAHDQLVAAATRMLKKLGYWKVMRHSHQARNTTHQCGTCCFGTDPATSVLDPYCRTHDVENLFVVDASFFPSSAAVNPGLTIIAQALRVADHIRATAL